MAINWPCATMHSDTTPYTPFMDKIFSRLTKEAVQARVADKTAREAIEHIAGLLESQAEGLPVDILHLLHQREKISSTALGHGVAIPHACVSDLPAPLLALITLETPIEFDTPDDQPIDVLLGLLLPDNQPDDNASFLRTVSHLLLDTDILPRCRACETDKALYQTILLTTVMRDE